MGLKYSLVTCRKITLIWLWVSHLPVQGTVEGRGREGRGERGRERSEELNRIGRGRRDSVGRTEDERGEGGRGRKKEEEEERTEGGNKRRKRRGRGRWGGD